MKIRFLILLPGLHFFGAAQEMKKENNANNQIIKVNTGSGLQAKQSGGPCYETKSTIYCNAPGEVTGPCVDICSTTKNNLCGSVTTKKEIPCGTQSSAQALPNGMKMNMLSPRSKNGDLGLAESSLLAQKYQAGFKASVGYIISDGKRQILHLYGQSSNQDTNINIPLENKNGELITGSVVNVNGRTMQSTKAEKVSRTGHVTLLK